MSPLVTGISTYLAIFLCLASSNMTWLITWFAFAEISGSSVRRGWSAFSSSIRANAFSEGVATSLIITEDTSLRGFLDSSLADCSISEIYIYYNFVDENGVAVEEEKLAPASYMYGKTIYVPSTSPYFTHYDWKDSSSGFNLLPLD